MKKSPLKRKAGIQSYRVINQINQQHKIGCPLDQGGERVAKRSEIKVVVEVIGKPDKERIFDHYRKFGLPLKTPFHQSSSRQIGGAI